MIESSFESALRDLAGPIAGTVDLSAPFATLFRVDGAAVSTLGGFLGSETLSASNAVALQIDEIQFDLGEGPCWDAMATGLPVLQPDIASGFHRWPMFVDALNAYGVTSIFAFPLRLGPLRIGAIDLYSHERTDLDEAESSRACRLADQVSRRVLRQALSSVHDEDIAASRPFTRRLIHQATGMVVSQLDISAEDAQLVIQGHAFAEGTTMMEVARLLIDRELVFTDPDAGEARDE